MRWTTLPHHPSIAPLQQRREDYRLEVPTDDEAVCTFKFVEKFERPSYAVTLEIRDISAGGLGLADYNHQLADVVGSTVRSCELKLPSHHRPWSVDLHVLRAQTEPLATRCAVTKVSCRFINLSDAASLAIRRYIHELERRRIAQRRGLD